VGAYVSSFNTRSGAVVPANGDYGSNKITNFSSAPGSTVDDALTYLRFGPLCPFSRTASGGISLTTSDRRRLIRVTSGPSTVTVPTNASQAFLEGDVLTFLTENADAITFTGAGGVTVHQPSTYSTNAWTYYYLKSLGADEWVVTQEAMAYHPLSIVNADVASGAAIAGTKISPNFGSQNVVTTGYIQAPQFGDGAGEVKLSAGSAGSGLGLRFQINGSDALECANGNFVTYQPDNYFGLNQGDTNISPGSSNGTGTLARLTVHAKDGNGSGTYKAGTLFLRGGNGSTGTGTGGDLVLAGGVGSAAGGNVAIGDFPASYQSMVKGVFLATAGTIPSGNPAAGFFLYVDPADNKLKCRGPSGTVTTLALP